MYSKDGYKKNSKDKNNPFNIIPSGNITMKDVDFPIYGVDDLGNQEIMYPGGEYIFPGNEVLEVPLYNLDRARQLNFPEKAPDDYNMLVENRPHWGSVDPESGDWLKSMDHPTAWMEYMNYALSPRSLNTDVVVDPSGYFDDRQLKYIPKYQRAGTIKRLVNWFKGKTDNVVDIQKVDNVVDPLNINNTSKSLNLPRKEDWLFNRHTDVNDIMEPMEFPSNLFRFNPNTGINVPVPNKISWFTPKSGAYTDYGQNTYTGNIIPKNPFYLDKNDIYSQDFIKDLINKNHDAIIVKGYKDGVLTKDIRFADEVVPLDKSIITNLEKTREYGGSIPGAQMGTFIKKLITGAKGLKKYFSKTKEGDIILDKDLQLLHGSDNPNLNFNDIELTEAYNALRSRQNSAKRKIKRMRKDGTFVPGDELAGFYSSPYDRALASIKRLNPKFLDGTSFQPISFNSNIGYKFDLAKGSRILDMSDLGTTSMSVRNLRKYLDEGYDGILGKDVTNSYEILPLNKDKIINWEKVNPFKIFNPNKFDLTKFQNAGEYDEDGYKTVTYGANKKKYQDTGTWSEYEPYETYSGDTWRKRTYELNRDDLRYLTHKKSFLTDVNYRTGKDNPPKSIDQFIRNTNKSWRVQEIIRDNGTIEYQLQYPTATNNFRTFASGDSESGLANLNPEYVQGLKKTGKTGISQFSSWFDMTPQERKDYGYSEWFDQGFTRDLKLDKDGKSKSGWKYYGTKTPLSYTLSDIELRRLPRSIVQKYNLVGNDKMTLNPNTGEIDFLTSTGGLRAAVSQKDMQWFQNPGRLKELATDDRFSYKEDSVLDYLNNPDFRYFADSQKISLDPVKLDGIPTKNEMDLQKPKPYESTISLESKTLDEIEIEREDEIIKRRPYEAPITLDPKEIKEIPTKELELEKFNPYQSAITLDKKEIEEIPTNDLSIIEQRKQETPITLDPINVTSINPDGTATTDGSKQRFVPKSEENTDEKRTKDKILEDLKNATGDDRKALYDELGWAYDHTIPESTNENKAEVVGDIINNFQEVKGTTKYVNKSVNAILDAVNKDDYTENDLSRDLSIFEKYYGQENLGYLKDMLDKTQGPKANRGIEVLEDGKFNIKMDRINSIINKYDASEEISPAEKQLLKSYNLISDTKPEVEEVKETDLVMDNKKLSLDDQIYIYNQYLDSSFTSDEEEKNSNKIVDKINRVYYSQAKQKDIHVYDLLLAMQNEMRQ